MWKGNGERGMCQSCSLTQPTAHCCLQKEMVLTKRPHPPNILSPSKALVPFVVLLTQWNYFCGHYQIAGFITPIKDLGVSNWMVLTQPWGYNTPFPGVWDLQLCSQIKMWMAKTGNLLKHLILLKHPTLPLLGWEKSTCMLSNIIQNCFVCLVNLLLQEVHFSPD